MDIDLCSLGLCSEHTLVCAETRDGQNVSCTCERGEQDLLLNTSYVQQSAVCWGGGAALYGLSLSIQ